jgi:hypothetical protein
VLFLSSQIFFRTKMTSRIHPHSEHADFIEHVERNRVTACESFFPSGERTFIRFTTLREYLTPMNIRRLLLCYFPTGTYWRAVHNGDYLVVFSILVYINKVSFLPYFLSNRRLSDQSLPFPHHYDWPRPGRSGNFAHKDLYRMVCMTCESTRESYFRLNPLQCCTVEPISVYTKWRCTMSTT